MDLSNQRTILITGASSGIGAALALKLARYGANLSICARREMQLLAVAKECNNTGARVFSYVADVSQKDQAENFVRRSVEFFGGVDVLVNNAGRGYCASVEDTTVQQIESMFALNVFALWSTCAIALPYMKRQGRGHIINVASMAGKIGYPYNSAYVAAKHAVVGFTASLRSELVGSGIDATVVCPSGVSSEWADVTEGSPIGKLFSDGIRRSRVIARENNIPLAPLKPMMSSEEAADLIISTILDPPPGDVYTHSGTREQAVLCTENRKAFEQQMLPLYLGMQEAYYLNKLTSEQ